MKTAPLGVVALSVLALTACHPKPLKHADLQNVTMDVSSSGDGSNSGGDDDDNGAPLKTLAALDCPASEGELTRTAEAGDGKSCDYAGPGDETVHLSLLAMDGRSVIDTVAPLKAELAALVHVPKDGGPVSVEAGGDHAKVDLPFLHVDANGDKAKVKLFGIDIAADGDHATVKHAPGLKNAIVHAGPGGAEVVAEDVGKSNASLVYILAGDSAGPSGYRAVGYVARGPVAGPLVVGEFKSKAEHHGDNHDDLDHLIERNVKE